jgi:hypothetical protein
MPTLKDKLMAAKAEESVRLESVRNYSGCEEASLLIEETVAPKPKKKKAAPKKEKVAKPKTVK